MKKLSDYQVSIREIQELARKEHRENMQAIGEKPLMGWTQEKHDNYHRERVLECDQVLAWLYWKLMQINPD